MNCIFPLEVSRGCSRMWKVLLASVLPSAAGGLSVCLSTLHLVLWHEPEEGSLGRKLSTWKQLLSVLLGSVRHFAALSWKGCVCVNLQALCWDELEMDAASDTQALLQDWAKVESFQPGKPCFFKMENAYVFPWDAFCKFVPCVFHVPSCIPLGIVSIFHQTSHFFPTSPQNKAVLCQQGAAGEPVSGVGDELNPWFILPGITTVRVLCQHCPCLQLGEQWELLGELSCVHRYILVSSGMHCLGLIHRKGKNNI